MVILNYSISHHGWCATRMVNVVLYSFCCQLIPSYFASYKVFAFVNSFTISWLLPFSVIIGSSLSTSIVSNEMSSVQRLSNYWYDMLISRTALGLSQFNILWVLSEPVSNVILFIFLRAAVISLSSLMKFIFACLKLTLLFLSKFSVWGRWWGSGCGKGGSGDGRYWFQRRRRYRAFIMYLFYLRVLWTAYLHG